MSPESGREYLTRLEDQYQIARRTLPRLPEDEFERVRRESARKEIGMESFLMGFAIGAETRRRNLERWATGRTITPASAEHAAAIISALPSYALANPEAMGAMKVEKAERFRIDIVAEDIIAEIAQRLPHTIDSYRYHQDYACETLNIQGLGEVKVTMRQTGNGIFTTIGKVEGETFKIWNSRASGVMYMDIYDDISRPSLITITDSQGNLPNKIKKMEINLGDDGNGVFVELDGKQFKNNRWRTAGERKRNADWQGDDLHRTYDGENEKDPRCQEINRRWRDDKTVLSWNQVEEDTIVWLAENVLNPLKECPKPNSQETAKPEGEPFPRDRIGPLYTFVKETDLKKIILIKGNPSKAYPDERKAVSPDYKLLLFTTPLRGASEVSYNGFVWCGVGEMNEEIAANPDMNIGLRNKHADFFNREGVAVIKPKTADNVYVVDWQARVDLKTQLVAGATAEGRDKFTYDELGEIEVAIAKTLVPIAKYNGGYKQPIVLIGRDIELDEVEIVYLLSDGRRLGNFD